MGKQTDALSQLLALCERMVAPGIGDIRLVKKGTRLWYRVNIARLREAVGAARQESARAP